MTIWFCEMKVRCPKFWGDLTQTENELVRDCAECGKQVHFVKSQEDLEEAAMKGNCVAFYESDRMPKHEVDQYERIWDLNKKTTVTGRRMTLGLPSTAKPFSLEDSEISKTVIGSFNTFAEVEIEFIEMLKRVGGGFKFVEWIEKKRKIKGERTKLARRTDSETAVGLYAADHSGKLHIVAYVCSMEVEGAFRMSGEITYYEDERTSIEELIGTSLGTVVASYSDQLVKKETQNFIGNDCGLLIYLMKSVDKNIADF
jgi:hypothetical protein